MVDRVLIILQLHLLEKLHCSVGVPWTEEEHKSFLIGLEKLGEGDWRGISRNFVTRRTPTQFASHVQWYLLRRNSLDNKKKKRRSSLFDVVNIFCSPLQVADGEMAGRRTCSSKHTDDCFLTLPPPPKTATIDLNSSSQEQGADAHVSHPDLELRVPIIKAEPEQSMPWDYTSLNWLMEMIEANPA
ncbi:hypothetical protein OPV22_010103 [Ensete ventricosum]|uniref:Uncharacterized protein n=1 Tax=Ensete ventricosum TaxID=4639 RepID=A0A444D8L1_ENSVE|nr:hypothetical protein OPV22_010103 [Ensete ventricosum]RRT43944.1 hypothetical protein B296_00027266 [Ensete ventricosum]RWV94431.1 hypothetical protein GW17_00043032 [Ensete ventricosum]RWW49897.1 hypothetical protein BHE74_00043875 [Ensete ventricosum]RZS14098.1 hypothetical protein BHM03_00045767 [Ensete ventricosum]